MELLAPWGLEQGFFVFDELGELFVESEKFVIVIFKSQTHLLLSHLKFYEGLAHDLILGVGPHEHHLGLLIEVSEC